MKRLSRMPAVLLFLLAIAGCGSNRQLQSVSLNPASADARNFPNGHVPFIATGTFSKPPSPVNLMSKNVFWCVGSSNGACVGNANPGANLDQNGAAQCNPGFAGTAAKGFRYGPVDLSLNSRARNSSMPPPHPVAQ